MTIRSAFLFSSMAMLLGGVAGAEEPVVESRKVSVASNKLVTEGKGGNVFAWPDVCKSPKPPAPFVPIPYPGVPNASELKEGKHKIVGGGKLVVTKSSGDEPGGLKGVVASKNLQEAEFVNFSFEVKAEGKQVVHFSDKLLINKKGGDPIPNPPDAVRVQLEDGTICGICMRNGKIRSIYKLRR